MGRTARRGTIQALVSAYALLTTIAAAAAPGALPSAGKAAVVTRPLKLTVTSARPSADRYSGAPLVLVTLSRDSARSLRILTGANLGRILEISLDGTLLTEPRILETIPGASFQISGSFTVTETRELARKMTSGGVLTARIRD